MAAKLSARTLLNWEVMESRDLPGEWRAEAIGAEGECYLARFFGPESEQRARDYAAWLNTGNSTR